MVYNKTSGGAQWIGAAPRGTILCAGRRGGGRWIAWVGDPNDGVAKDEWPL